MTEAVRLSKRVIELTGCSRREAELYIEGGWVSVDGQIIEQPQFKVENQHVCLLENARAEPVQPATLMYHVAPNQPLKLELAQRWEQDPSGVRALAGHRRQLEAPLALYPNASGMLILSQDWRTLRKLHEDGHKLEQEYLIEVSGRSPETSLERFARGFLYQGQNLSYKLSWQNEQRLRLAIKQPPHGCIEALCKPLKLTILSIHRIRIGGLAMGKLPSEQWRYLSATERF